MLDFGEIQTQLTAGETDKHQNEAPRRPGGGISASLRQADGVLKNQNKKTLV